MAVDFPMRRKTRICRTRKLSIAIVGAGMGGLAVAATLRRAAIEFRSTSRPRVLRRIGAGIQMMPNSMKVLRGIGVEDRLRAESFAPYSHLNRLADTGEVMRELPMPESLYGAPYLCMHRADLHDALASAVPAEIIHLGKKLVGLDQSGGAGDVALRGRQHGQRRCGDRRRRRAFGRARHHRRAGRADPQGRIAYRAVFPAALMGGFDIGRRAPNGGAPTATSSSITPPRRRARSISSPACRSRPNG